MSSFPGHWAVIMARGDSRRMGFPKGLARLNDRGPNLVTRILCLYQGLGIKTLLVVRAEDEAAYRAQTPVKPDLWCAGPGGRDTAATMKLALETCQDLPVQWFWAHPVDLPLVNPETLNHLVEASEAAAGPIRPWCQGRPGHPVLFPAGPLQAALSLGENGHSMSELWSQAQLKALVPAMDRLDVADTAVVTDFDRPDQLDTVKDST